MKRRYNDPAISPIGNDHRRAARPVGHPLTELAREGARRMLAEALQQKAMREFG